MTFWSVEASASTHDRDAFEAAAEQIGRAEERVAALPAGAYGDMIRAAIGGVRDAITARDTTPRSTSPTVTATD